MAELGEYLDIHDVFFEVGEYDNVGVAFRYSSPTDNVGKMRRPDQMTNEWLIDFVASLGKSVQIRQNENGVKGFDTLLSEGLITSNARMLRPKGVDFYINPWIGDKFAPVTEYQREVDSEYSRQEREEEPVVRQEVPVPDDFEFGDRDDDSVYVEDVNRDDTVDDGLDDMAKALGMNNGSDVTDIINKKYSELSSDIKSRLDKKGYTESEYDSMSDIMKERVLKCL